MLVGLLFALAGLALMGAAGLSHRVGRQRELDRFLGLAPVVLEADDHDEVGSLAGRAVDLAAQMVDRVDRKRSLSQGLERAKIPLRPGEFVIVVAGCALAVAALVLLATHSRAFAVLAAVLTGALGPQVVRRRVAKRTRAFEVQLPDALSIVASSLTAGHTFLRAIQMMCEESTPPLAEEFSRVVAETRLGDPLVDALERMSDRLGIRDMNMVVQAVRIQQTIGGRLADLLHTLSDFIRARDEVRREVQVLTAEGRMSAYVLAGLVPFLFGVINVLNPVYVKPLYHGWGIGILVYCAGSVLVGMVLILRMVKIEI